ncbi:MAG: hypothetical protein IPK74_18705 [Deltaproteobacteria bacterium]|nr:hypothetical protein [Deltaproteobacteria bacterium]
MRERSSLLAAAFAAAMPTAGGCAEDGVGTSTGEVEGCSRVHEGDLYVLEDTDLASLSDIQHVTGAVLVSMGVRQQPDLAFLSCLEIADFGVSIDGNAWLETTKGLTQLTELQNLAVNSNPSLRTIEGFENIEKIATLDISHNDALEEIHLESVESIELFNLGHCSGLGIQLSGNDSLVDVGGLVNLASVGSLQIRGNEALVSTQVLDALASNGAPPLDDVRIMWNPKLPEQEVNAKLDALGVEGSRWVCGNAGGVQDECDCGIE